jgi:hypothetical protein
MESSDSGSVCFTRQDFNTYTYLLLMLLVYIVYILYQKRENLSVVDVSSHLQKEELSAKVKELQEQLYTFQLAEQRCRTELVKVRSKLVNSTSNNSLMQKIYNPLVAPERRYEGVKSETGGYQMIGYVYNNNDRYPLFGRYKYPGRTEKWEYYVIDETRNRLKIPFKTSNDNEITDGDTINIPTLGDGYSAKIYEYEQLRYNPNL